MQVKKNFIGIDSDGCVLDSMSIKQRACFCPQFIKHMRLESISKYANETWEFVSLYSRTRGANRFIALIRALDLLRTRSEILEANVAIPELPDTKAWIESTTSVSSESLGIEIEKSCSKELSDVLAWSNDIDKALKENTETIQVFQMVVDCLTKMGRYADVAIVSQTPSPIIAHEWKEKKIDSYVFKIFGQGSGTKYEQLTGAIQGKYKKEHCLMIGDAWGDYEAAKLAGISFYPINPGSETQSWQKFYSESLDMFFEGSYTGDYEANLVKKFGLILPSEPNW